VVLWFVGLSMVGMWVVFRDPAIDHRTVMAGALLPLALDLPWGRATVVHTLLFAVALMLGVMVLTGGRRAARRRWLGLAIGCFFHLVLDGTWTEADLFWWPALGFGFPDVDVPELGRTWTVVLVQELVGLVALVWAWFRFGLADAGRRGRFLRTGRIDRSVTEPGAPPSC
jgi:hypothetical protein